MKLVDAKCPNCGGTLKIDAEKDAAICEYCGKPFIVEKAINNFNVHVTNNINNDYSNSTIYMNNDKEKFKNYYDFAVNSFNTSNYKDAFLYSCKALEIDCKNFTLLDIKARSGILSGSIDSDVFYSTIDNAAQFAENADEYYKLILSFVVRDIAYKNLKPIEDDLRKTNPSLKEQHKKRVWAGEGPLFLNPAMANADENYVNNCYHQSVYYFGLINPTSKESIEMFKKAEVYSIFLDCCSCFQNIYILLKERLSIYGIKIASDAEKIFGDCINSFRSLLDTQDTSRFENKTPKLESGFGCYVATCVYGSYDCPQVWTLRRYRDYYLDEHWWGRVFIKIYYFVSPKIVKIFGKCKWFKKINKTILDKKIAKLHNLGYLDTKYDDKY